MSQKAKSKGEKAWAKLQIQKAEEKIATGWMGRLQAKAKAARAAKAEWEKQESPAEQQWRQAQQLQAEISEINNAISVGQDAALEQIRLIEEDTRHRKETSQQQILMLEEQLQQLRRAVEAQADNGDEPLAKNQQGATVAAHTHNPTQPSVQDLHQGRALAARIRLNRAQQQRDAMLEGMRWGTRAYWRDKIRECVHRAKLKKIAEDTTHLHTTLQELRVQHEQSEAEVWQLQSDLDAEIDAKLHWQAQYEKAKNKSKKKKVPPEKEKPKPSDEDKDDAKPQPFDTWFEDWDSDLRGSHPEKTDADDTNDTYGFVALQAQIKTMSQKYD